MSKPGPAETETAGPALRPPEARRLRIDFGLFFVAALAVGSGAAVWHLQGRDRFLSLLFADLATLGSLLPKIFGSILLAVGLSMVLPREKVLRLIGPESGLRGLFLASLAGALIPGGPNMTFPLTLALMAAGADLGAGLALITGWVLLGTNRILIWELSLLPGWLVALRIGLSLAVPMAIGALGRRLLAMGWAASLSASLRGKGAGK